jgi:hypothetical protein
MPPQITWNGDFTRGTTPAGHLVAVLRTRSGLRTCAIKMPPGGDIVELYSTARDDCEARLVAEELVQWPA